jgi:hypothetical protein
MVSFINSSPSNITFSYSSSTGNLTIGWPVSQTGWRLLAQTNSVNTGLLINTNGLAFNPANWAVVPGSSATNQVIMPLDATNEVFFQLVYP